MAANVDQRLFEVFSRTDSTKAGRLDVAQLQRYLRDHRHLHFSLMSVARLVRLYDTSKTGRLDFAGFVSYVGKQRVHVDSSALTCAPPNTQAQPVSG